MTQYLSAMGDDEFHECINNLDNEPENGGSRSIFAGERILEDLKGGDKAKYQDIGDDQILGNEFEKFQERQYKQLNESQKVYQQL